MSKISVRQKNVTEGQRSGAFALCTTCALDANATSTMREKTHVEYVSKRVVIDPTWPLGNVICTIAETIDPKILSDMKEESASNVVKKSQAIDAVEAFSVLLPARSKPIMLGSDAVISCRNMDSVLKRWKNSNKSRITSVRFVGSGRNVQEMKSFTSITVTKLARFGVCYVQNVIQGWAHLMTTLNLLRSQFAISLRIDYAP